MNRGGWLFPTAAGTPLGMASERRPHHIRFACLVWRYRHELASPDRTGLASMNRKRDGGSHTGLAQRRDDVGNHHALMSAEPLHPEHITWPPLDKAAPMSLHFGGRIVCRRSHVWLLACVLVVLPAHALAQPLDTAVSSAQDGRPWAVGVSAHEQDTALDLYTAGNHEFAESRFAQAITKYREAIQHWDHPAIRYNLAISLVEVNQLVEARDNLVRSIAYGPAALPAEKHPEGLRYLKLLDGQLAHLKIACPEPGAEVTLDGKLLLTGPGNTELFLLPGTHQLVATKPGFLTASRSLDLAAGKLTAYDIAPTIETKPVTRTVRRWERWKPWAVLGSGAAIAALGASTYAVASQQYAAYDDLVQENCSRGCTAEELGMLPEVARQQRRADRVQMVAFSLFSVGGAGIIAGLVGLAMNQPRVQLEARPAPVTIAPTPGGLQVSASWRF